MATVRKLEIIKKDKRPSRATVRHPVDHASFIRTACIGRAIQVASMINRQTVRIVSVGSAEVVNDCVSLRLSG